MPDSNPPSTTRFRYRLSPVEMKRGLWIVLVSLLVLLTAGLLASDHLGDTILEDLQKQPGWALGLALLGIVALGILIARIVREAGDAWLAVDSDGIRCSPHKHHGPRNWLRQDWRLPWSAVDRAVVRRPGPKSHHVQNWINTTLTLESDQGDHSLGLLQWEPVDQTLDRPDLMAFRPGKRLHRLTETHPLIGHLEHRGIEVEYEALGLGGRWGLGKSPDNRPEARDGDAPVDLLGFPSLVVMLSLMGLAGVAAALHFAVGPPIRALFSPSYGLAILLGSAVFAAGVALSRAAPLRERTIVALLLGVTVSALWHPLSLRVQTMQGESPRSVDYIVEQPGRFSPVDPTLPPLDLSDLEIPEYWESLAPGSTHEFEIQRLGPERRVLRLGALYEQTRAFYSDREDEGRLN